MSLRPDMGVRRSVVRVVAGFDGPASPLVASKPVRAERGIASCAYASVPSCALSKTIPEAGVRVDRGSAVTTLTDGAARLDRGGCELASTVTLLVGVPDELSRPYAEAGGRAVVRDVARESGTTVPVGGVGGTELAGAVSADLANVFDGDGTTGMPVGGVDLVVRSTALFPNDFATRSTPATGVGVCVRGGFTGMASMSATRASRAA